MTDYERFKSAKNAIVKLANGRNPYNDEPLPNDTILNDVGVARALLVASKAIDVAISTEMKKVKKPKKQEFSISAEKLTEFRFSDTPLFMKEIIRRIEELKYDEYMKKFPEKLLLKWLIDKELIVEVVYNGKTYKQATEKGNSIGIYSDWKTNPKFGKFLATVYDLDAQYFIIDNLPEILTDKSSISKRIKYVYY